MIIGSILQTFTSKLLQLTLIVPCHQFKILVGSGVIAYTLNLSTGAMAQIVPDNSLGAERSMVTPVIQNDNSLIQRIDGGAIRGSSLFHSFQDFNVGSGQRVYFSNPSGIANILGRVTGNQASNILGTLGVLGSANLYLINPNGIIFGRNARLDVSGSFFASTSQSLLLDNGYRFSTQNPQAPPLLTINLRPGLDSWSSPQGAIANNGNLSTGQNLSLLGTNLFLQGQLQAGSNLTLQATNTIRGSADLSSRGATLIRARGDVNFNNYQGSSLQVLAGGSINANNIFVSNQNLTNNIAETVTLADGITSVALNSQEQPIVDLRAGVRNVISPISSTGSRLTSADITVNQIINAGGLVFLTNQYQPNPSLSGNIRVNSTLAAFGDGAIGGDIVVDSRGQIITPTFLTSFGADGQFGGNITLIAQDDIIIPPSSLIFSDGNITLKSQSNIILDNAAIISDNQINDIGGNITIQANNLTLDNQSQISTRTASTEGANINIQLTDSLLLRRGSSISAIAGNEITGANGANITINTDLLFAVPEENSDIIANAFSGSGGKVNITARNIQGIGFSDSPNSSSSITSSARKPPVPSPPLEVPVPPPPPLENPVPTVEISQIGSFNEQETSATSVTVELPNPQSDRNNQIVTASCRATDGNSFTITGRGGLPTDPTATIRGQTLLSDIRDFTTTQNRNQTNNSATNSTTPKAQIVAATGWIINHQGQVKLVSALPQESILRQNYNCSDLPENHVEKTKG